VAALVKQAYPELTGLEVRERIRAGARVDEHVIGNATHPVDQLWGAGKVSAYRAVFNEPPPANTPPSIATEPVEAESGETVTLPIAVADAESAVGELVLRVDTNYDGSWDEEIAATQAATARFDDVGTFYVKAQVVDEHGSAATALVRVTVVEGDGCDCRAAHAPSGTWLPGLAIGLLALRRRQTRRMRRAES
jgi:MYXO-CTERM domain-containing protein